jgi:hypothetical protein
MVSAETDGMGGNGRGEWLSISCFMLRVGCRLTGGEDLNSLAPLPMLRSISGLPDGSGVRILSSSLCLSSLTGFFTLRFSGAGSSEGGGDGFVKSWGPHISPDRRRGLACFRRGIGDWHSGLGRRDSGNDSLDMWGSFTEGS